MIKKQIIPWYFIAVAFLFGCGETDDKSSAKTVAPPKVVAWLELAEPSKQRKRLLSGQVSAAERTQLSFQAQGQIQQIALNVGENFAKGQVLARLDDTTYQLQWQQAQAQLRTATAQQQQAQKEVKRHEKLIKSKAVSQIQLDNFRLQFTAAQQSVKAAQAQLALAEKQLADTALLAPFAGTVTAQLAEVAQLVNPSVPVLMVQANQVPEATFSIPENWRADLNVGQTAAVSFPALSTKPITGRISEISEQARLGAFPAKLTLVMPPSAVKAGMTAEIHFTLPPRQTAGFAIAPSALGASANNQHYVYRIIRIEQQQQLEKLPVKVVSLSEKQVVITGALQAGDKLVRSGVGFLHDKQNVALMNVGARRVNP